MEFLKALFSIFKGLTLIALAMTFSIFALDAIGYCLDGYILTKLWVWFVVPVFHLSSISVLQAIGIAIVIGSLIGTSRPQLTEN